MALRVLLADESSTIKKVIQLSLQDFGVDVKSVTVGLDVLSVAKTFRPDVVLADVLLAKRSGYEVCHDLKNDQETSQIPVVLMWSGFMEIDEQKARLCGADRRIEKPFDASALRQIVQELVSRTQNNPVSSFVQFPTLPPFEESKKPPVNSKAGIPFSVNPTTPTSTDENEALVIDDSELENSDEWVQQPISPKSAQTTAQASQNSSFNPTFPIQNRKTPDSKTKEDDFTEFSLTQQQTPSKAPTGQQQSVPSARNPEAEAGPRISEHLVREEIQKWLAQHMPDIAERLIRDEINRLLQESEKTIQAP